VDVADAKGYVSPYWLTYRQAEALGAQVRKGEKASHTLFYKMLGEPQDTGVPEAQIDEQKRRRVLRSYAILNADQIDGLPSAITLLLYMDAATMMEAAQLLKPILQRFQRVLFNAATGPIMVITLRPERTRHYTGLVEPRV
jgi:antirestriction protein ArdC